MGEPRGLWAECCMVKVSPACSAPEVFWSGASLRCRVSCPHLVGCACHPALCAGQSVSTCRLAEGNWRSTPPMKLRNGFDVERWPRSLASCTRGGVSLLARDFSGRTRGRSGSTRSRERGAVQSSRRAPELRSRSGLRTRGRGQAARACGGVFNR